MRILLPFLFALGTAVCWGLYGPILGRARVLDEDLSPFKPYVMIGVAYLIIAIAGGLVGMWYNEDSFHFTSAGGLWGIAAGTLGALGALCLTLCMFKGGNKIPHAVMPVVFGGAVTVTAVFTLLSSGGTLHASKWLWVGVAGMLVSIVIITVNTPHAAPKPPSASVAASAPPPAVAASPGAPSDSVGGS